MTETYVTYLVWDGCRAPGNLECNGRLCGQRVREVPVDREALLELAEDVTEAAAMATAVDASKSAEMLAELLLDIARRIREACGEVVG